MRFSVSTPAWANRLEQMAYIDSSFLKGACLRTKTYGHLGIYGYTRSALLKMTELEQSELEKAESLEQLRALQNGMKIKTFVVDFKPIGIDTKEDLEAFKKAVLASV